LFKSQEEAEKSYIDFVNELSKDVAPEPVVQNTKFTEILTTVEYGNIYKIVLNRPNKRNALNLKVLILKRSNFY
jgi:hypothetical protein